MFIFLAQNKTAYDRVFKKAQLAPLFIALISIIIIAVMVTVNLGKISLTKTHTANASDAGTLAAASQMAFAFNLLATQAAGMYATYLASFTAADYLLQYAQEDLEIAAALSLSAEALGLTGAALACVPYSGKYLWMAMVNAAIAMFIVSEYYFALLGADMTAAESTINDIYEAQLKTYLGDNMTYSVEDEDENIGMRESVTHNVESARELAYDYTFLNSGISEKLNPDLDIDGQPAEDESGEKINPTQGTEFSYHISDKETPQEFRWRDGQAREHLVNVDVELADVTRYQFIKTNRTKEDIEGDFATFWIVYTMITLAIMVANANLTGQIGASAAVPDCGAWHIPVPWGGCIIPATCAAYSVYTIAIIAAFVATLMEYVILGPLIDDIREGIAEDGLFWDDDGNVEHNILVTLFDVDHPRRIEITTFQEHGAQDMGLWEAKYPKVKSQSQGSFACNPDDPDCGGVGGSCDSHGCSCLNGKDPCATHEPVIVEVDEF